MTDKDTLLICDSTSDISLEEEEKLGIRIINCFVELDGLPYEERVEITPDRVFSFVEQTGKMPHHSQITVIRFVEEYMKAARDGYKNVICVTMNKEGSGTYSAACHAISMLSSEYPALEGKINIRVIDSGTYSMGIANGILLGVKSLKEGRGFEETADLLEDYYRNQMTLVGLYTLKYAKKSGRLNATAAIIGEALGIKPVLGIRGFNRVLEKARGDKNLIPKMTDMYFEMAEDPNNGDYAIAYGDDPETGRRLSAAIKKRGGRAPVISSGVGTCVGCNSGPNMVGLCFRTKKDIEF